MQDYQNCTFHESHVVLFLVKNTCVLAPPEREKRERERERETTKGHDEAMWEEEKSPHMA